MGLLKERSCENLSQPENFDIIKSFDSDEIDIWGGCNDWEDGITVACARTRPDDNGSMEQVWFTIALVGRFVNCNDEVYCDYSSKVLETWCKVAQSFEKREGDGIYIDYFEKALSNENVKEYVEEWGKSRTVWESM